MEKIRNFTFEWKIVDFLEQKDKVKDSRQFKYGGNTCYLEVVDSNLSCKTCPLYYTFCFIWRNAFPAGVTLKCCLIDTFGEEIYVTKHNTYEKMSTMIRLMTIPAAELMHNSKLLPSGILTVRLFLYETRQETQSTTDLISDAQGPLTMLDTLSKDFTCFFESKEATDCVLRVGDAKFPVHRAILSARSKVFPAMFRHDTSESRSGFVDIQDVEADVLSDFLYYVYSGKVHGLTPNTAVPLYNVADKYALFELRDFCRDFLENNLMIGNVCDAAILAHSHGEEELERAVIEFIQDKMEEVENSDEWKNLEIIKPSLVIKLLRFTVKACKDKIKETSSK